MRKNVYFIFFIFLFSGYKSDWKWNICRLFKCSVCEHLWHGEFHRPLCRCDHLSSTDSVQVFLQLPYAVPSQQHPNRSVSVLADSQNHNQSF